MPGVVQVTLRCLWWWSDADARRLTEGAGFIDVSGSALPVATKEHVFRGTRPADIG